jgi:hypothetical protein
MEFIKAIKDIVNVDPFGKQLSPAVSLTDFEMAIIKEIGTAFPNIKIKGNFFPF